MKIIEKITSLKDKDKKTLILVCVAALVILIAIALTISSGGGDTVNYNGPDASVIPSADDDLFASDKGTAFDNEQDRSKGKGNKGGSNPYIDDEDPNIKESESGIDAIFEQSVNIAPPVDPLGNAAPAPTGKDGKDKPAPPKKTRQEEVNEFFFGREPEEEEKKEEEKKEQESVQPSGGSGRGYTRSSDPEERLKESLALQERLRSATVSPEEAALEKARKEKAERDSIEARKREAVSEALAPKATIRRSSGVSSLEDTEGSLNDNSIESLGEHDELSTLRPIAVRFAQTMDVKSGQRVQLRLMEDLVVNNILIPSNSTIPAVVNINGNRVNITVTTLMLGGRMYTLNYKAYDTDGGLGLYCPTTKTSEIAEQALTEGANIATSALMERLTGWAGRAFNSAVSITRNANSDKPVTVPSGYTFFIMEDPKI